ncbi:CCA tRNA nucleotidyltransferase [Paenibacillus tarimensis]|uniref:CCA tRNA nucleotidyltransferase n=1 Tax=Paenibacillus tarimensis TaxID=416012 RepID=UPI001F3FCD5E|nr:CCA tRNA nucleotidyltransferase [Paenibacillus tarimensis]MCF2942581.1 CCA tRNA nucleotidyltransferase [Paenibacillus tarimensis]
MKMELDKRMAEAVPILRRLNEAGYEAYFVGGCVRDLLMGRRLSDVDIATSAQPDSVMELFPRCVPTGLRHGTVTVLEEGKAYEITTFREESEYEQHRRPQAVRFIQNLEGDLLRRDFTINAMAMDVNGEIKDPFGGVADMERRILRCVGDPDARLQEDALRMLRGIRFASMFGYSISYSTWKAMLRHRNLLSFIAMERVGSELDKMLSGTLPAAGLTLLGRSGLWRHFKQVPPLNRSICAAEPFGNQPAGTWPAALDLRWAYIWISLMADHEELRKWLLHFNFGKQRVERIAALVHMNAAAVELIDRSAASQTGAVYLDGWIDLLLRFGRQTAMDWIELKIETGEGLLPAMTTEKLSELRRTAEELSVLSPADLAIGGDDVKAVTDKPAGPWIRRLLGELVRACAHGQIPNTKEALLSEAAIRIEKEQT